MDVVKSILEGSEQSDPHKSTTVHKEIELEFDEALLLASDYNPINLKGLSSEPEKYLQNLTRDNVQLLLNKIWNLPFERVDEAVVAKLPKPQYVLPRSRCIPKPKPLTKWQQFAKEKGITSKKNKKLKSKWDDELKKWIPTYGYKHAKAEEQKDWIIEVNNDNKSPGDPHSVKKSDKQERQSKNELQRLRNIAKAQKIKLPKVGLPTTEYFPRSQHLSTALTVARTSTASVGKYQAKLPKEKDAKGIAREVPGLKRKAKEPPLNAIEEKKRHTDLIERILKPKPILNEISSIPSTSAFRSKSKTEGKKKKPGKSNKSNKNNKTSKKPKAGKGKRDLHTKVGGRKRR